MSDVRDEHYDPFRQLPTPARPLEALVFVMARERGDLTDYPVRRARRAFPVFDSLNRDAGRQLVKTQSSAL